MLLHIMRNMSAGCNFERKIIPLTFCDKDGFFVSVWCRNTYRYANSATS